MGKGVWNINDVVDLYNCCSVRMLLPMGGYDLDKITGDIFIRFAKEGEPFTALGENVPIHASANHIVYADERRILCWLWNHKDSAFTCIDDESQDVIFFIDALEQGRIQKAVELLAHELSAIGNLPCDYGILNAKLTEVDLDKLTS